ncbi:hypothetical protein Thimo_3058 [Thioflavicoccus mobilis 8321]|uniref:Uncharacterized protein n=1 Tax=Thioflavicoccus mobilis 8321 TaxID=765912 RepID=L0H0J4_9GAMM|nr:hypothetical protein Thimo_3058 [Thioflavicoccus mobilis 8321]
MPQHDMEPRNEVLAGTYSSSSFSQEPLGSLPAVDGCAKEVDKPIAIVTAWQSRLAFRRIDGEQLVESPRQLILPERNGDAWIVLETLDRGELVVIAMLAQRRSTRHDQQALAQLEGRDDGPHARVPDNHIGRSKGILVRLWG